MGGHFRPDWPLPEYMHYVEFCGLTDDEIRVLERRRHGDSLTEIASDLNLSESSIDRRIKSIKTKIKRDDALRMLN